MMTRRCLLCGMALFASAAVLALPTQVGIRMDIVLSTIGPAVAIGILSKNAIRMWSTTIGGQRVQVIVLDDAPDLSMTVWSVRKLIVEDKVGVIVGPTIVPATPASFDAVAEGQTPMITLTASTSIVESQDTKRRWAFKTPQNNSQMATLVTQHMTDNGVHTVGFIGFIDAYGKSWWREFSRLADVRKLRVVTNERFARADISVTGQTLKLVTAKSDATLITGVGTPTALPRCTLVGRGYKDCIYQTHGIANTEFLKVGGKDVEGTSFPIDPAVIVCELPASHLVRKVVMEFINRYEVKYDPNIITQSVGSVWGAWQLLDDAMTRALKTSAEPGTPVFRTTLYDALKATRDLTVPNGVLSLDIQDHQGFGQRLRVMSIIKNDHFTYAGPY